MNKSSLKRYAAIGAAIIGTFLPHANAAVIAVAGNGGQFGRFDLATRSYTQIAANAFSPSQLVTGLAYDTATGTTYFNAFTGSGGDTNTQLRTVNLLTGSTALVATYNMSGGADLIGLGINSLGAMYSYSWTADFLVTVNKTTAATAGLSGSGFSSDRTTPFYTGKLAFVGNALYGTIAANSGAANGLYSFNLTTGSASLLGNGGSGATYTDMIAFSDGGSLYGINGTTLYSIDTANGNFTSLGAITGANLPTKFVSAVAVPEPSSSLLVATTLAGICILRNRRKVA